jgi:uncharacterized protein DUF5666
MAQASQSATGQSSPVSRIAGTIKAVEAQAITLTSDSGAEVTAHLASATRIVRVAPGQKDLTNAMPVALRDLQPGDRVLVRGPASADGKSIVALAVIVMKQDDITAKRERDRQDWQKRGVGGLVDSVDAASGTVTISTGGLATTKKLLVRTTKETILRRYAPDSVKFDDAKPAPIDQVRAGDQLRARGARSADGNELTAEEIVSGTFRNIAGTVTGVDTSQNTITVKDAIAKDTVTVKIGTDSQLKKLPAEMAQRIAIRLKAASGQGGTKPATADAARRPAGAPNEEGQWQRGPDAAGQRGNGAPDLDRLLSRMPNSTLSDLQKGDAVMIVSTSGEAGTVTAITLLAGVEPILTASPNQNASALMLSPWTLGGGSAEAEAGP